MTLRSPNLIDISESSLHTVFSGVDNKLARSLTVRIEKGNEKKWKVCMFSILG